MSFKPISLLCYILLDLSVFFLRRNKIEINAVQLLRIHAAGNCQ